MFGGTEFGAVGPYERLHGTVFGELDPTHPLNAGIVNLDRAARNAQRQRRVSQRLPDLEAARSRSRQWVPRLRRAQSRQPADHAAAQRRAGRRAPAACRQRLSDAARLHAGVERLAGRRAARQRSPDGALSDHPRHHRHGAGGVHRREHRAARRHQHPGAVGRALRRHPRLSGCRPGRGDADGAASARPIRASRRPVLRGVWSTTAMSRSRGRPRRASTAARSSSSSTAPAIRS